MLPFDLYFELSNNMMSKINELLRDICKYIDYNLIYHGKFKPVNAERKILLWTALAKPLPYKCDKSILLAILAIRHMQTVKNDEIWK